MKAVIQDLKTGHLTVDEVPPPGLRPEGVLVRVRRSLISLGTERAIIALARKGPLGKARDRPDLARKVLAKARQEGFWSTYQVVRNLISSPIPLGYSSAGEVIQAGREVTELQVGDRVACAGLNYANHAEINFVPRNLAVKLPPSVPFEEASFVTVGAIAMQGIRLAEIELGERIVVLGLGLVGQIAAQIARCAGATVVAMDLDRQKCELAGKLGSHRAVDAAASVKAAVSELTGGQGADAVLICAATKASEPIRLAAELSRLRGRVVVVGDVGMEIERRPYYEKELKLIVSRSYGPGRYDPAYEARGSDYPFAYVRWTEGRNMSSFIELVARGDVDLQGLITHRFPVEEAESAYRIVTGESKEPAVAIVLEYAGEDEPQRSVALRTRASPPRAGLRLGVVGAGQFAKGVLLPAFRAQPGVRLEAVCTSSGLTSKKVAERYGARYCTSDPSEIFADPDIEAVIIATRHDQHAALTLEALRAGKAVFVEKPLAITEPSLAQVVEEARQWSVPPVMVGFNRRFAPLARACREVFADLAEPIFLTYRVNAGAVPPDSWVVDPVEGGGRLVGEVCHFIDTLCYLTDSVPAQVFAQRLGGREGRATDRENLTLQLRLANGSVGTIHYLANGDPSLAKEYLEVFGGGRSAILDNYRTLTVHRENRKRRRRLMNQAKGHRQEVEAFVGALSAGGAMPIDWQTIVSVSQTTFLAHRSLDTGLPVSYAAPTAASDSWEGAVDTA